MVATRVLVMARGQDTRRWLHEQNVIVYNGTTDLKIPYFAEENGLWVAI